MVAILAGCAAIDLYGDPGDLAAAAAAHDETVATARRHVGEQATSRPGSG